MQSGASYPSDYGQNSESLRSFGNQGYAHALELLKEHLLH